jgi:hypothetical protein
VQGAEGSGVCVGREGSLLQQVRDRREEAGLERVLYGTGPLCLGDDRVAGMVWSKGTGKVL